MLFPKQKNIFVIFAFMYAVLILGFFLGYNDTFLYRGAVIVYILSSSYLIARHILDFHGVSALLISPLLSTLPIMIIGSVIYLFSGLYQWTVLLLLGLPLVPLFFMRSETAFPPRIRIQLITALQGFLLALFAAFELASFAILYRHQTIESALGPWEIVSPGFLVLFFCASLLLLAMAFSSLSPKFVLPCLSIHFFNAFTVAYTVFPLGFGFDPHIHQATEKLISENGFVHPKTLYYMGQYVLVGFWSKLLAVRIEAIDRLLVPVLASTALPAIAFSSLQKFFSFDAKWALVGVLLVLAIPFSYGISSTPWALAFVLTLCVSFASLLLKEQKSKIIEAFLLVLSLAALTAHPLAGLPLIGAVLAHLFASWRRWVIAALFAVSVPAAFLANAALSSHISIAIQPQLLHLASQVPALFSIAIDSRFNIFLDAAYFFQKNYLLFFLIAAIAGLLLHSRYNHKHISLFHALGLMLTLLNGLVVAAVLSFPDLISYEQNEYAIRLLQLSLVFLAPFFLYSLVRLLQKSFFQSTAATKIASLLTLGGILTASLYTSYPRNDAFASYHGYSVSQADIETVKFINTDADNTPFIVLSNQVVAAAAVKEYGFKKYYTVEKNDGKSDVFYYPIPTSSPLYTTYRQMLQAPDNKTARTATELVGVEQVYFVVNSYEDRFQNIIDKAKKSANGMHSIGQKNYIFRYNVPVQRLEKKKGI